LEMLFPANVLASIEKTKIKTRKQKITTKIYNKPRLTERKYACIRNTKILKHKIN